MDVGISTHQEYYTLTLAEIAKMRIIYTSRRDRVTAVWVFTAIADHDVVRIGVLERPLSY